MFMYILMNIKKVLLMSCFIIRRGFAVKPSSVVRRFVSPIGENQKLYCEYLGDEGVQIVAGLGPAGCGKTLFACQAAVSALVSGSVDKIVMTRPLVSVDEELGFLPGTIEHKMNPWVRPIFDVLGGFYTGGEIRRMMDDGVLEISPLAYMRGRTFKRSFIVADEMQNSSPNQMLMMLTRLGEGSKAVITGDLQQSDLAGKNGLADFYGRLRRGSVEGIRMVEFETVDVKRSSVVAAVLALYDRREGNNDAAIIPKHLL
jgi:phosphate starvation-inducible PhoH-like protein